MSPEAQKFLIAGAMGLVTGRELGYSGEQANELYRPDPNGTWHDLATWKKTYDWVQGFDPLNDLNVMHESEKVLTDDQYHHFTLELSRIGWLAFPDQLADSAYKSRLRASFSATAAQRAESFLRTLGLWQDA